MRSHAFPNAAACLVSGIMLTAACNVSTSTPADSRRLTLALIAPEEVRVGAVVPITLRLTNTTPDSIRIVHGGFAERIYFDVIVSRPDGSIVWNNLHGKTILLASNTRTMVPREVIDLNVAWDLRDNAGQLVAPGTYRVHGKLEGSQPPSSNDLSTPVKTLAILP